MGPRLLPQREADVHVHYVCTFTGVPTTKLAQPTTGPVTEGNETAGGKHIKLTFLGMFKK